MATAQATAEVRARARPRRNEIDVSRPAARPSLRELLKEIRFEGVHLVRKEIELVRIELREDLRTEAIASAVSARPARARSSVRSCCWSR